MTFVNSGDSGLGIQSGVKWVPRVCTPSIKGHWGLPTPHPDFMIERNDIAFVLSISNERTSEFEEAQIRSIWITAVHRGDDEC